MACDAGQLGFWHECIFEEEKKILTDETVNVRRYQIGKLSREALLAYVDLLRDGSKFALGVPKGGGSETGPVGSAMDRHHQLLFVLLWIRKEAWLLVFLLLDII